MLLGVIAEELLLPTGTSSFVSDDDVIPSPRIFIRGYVIHDADPFEASDVIYEFFINNITAPALYPQRVDAPDILYTMSSAHIRTLSPSRFAETDAFFSPIVNGRVLGPSLFVDPDMFRGIASLTQFVRPDVFSDLDDILDLIPQTGINWIVIPHRFAEGDIVFAPAVPRVPALFVDIDEFISPVVAARVAPSSVFSDNDVFFISSAGAPGVHPSLFVEQDVIYAPGGGITALDTVIDTDVFLAFVTNVTMPLALFVDSDTFSTPSLIPYARWDGPEFFVDKSNNDLTGTLSFYAGGGSGVRTFATQWTGKYYYEVRINTTHGHEDGAGILEDGATFTQMAVYWEAATAYFVSGTIISNYVGGGVATFPTLANADYVGIAVDLDTRKAWFRKNAGSWNNNSANDPATGVGGITIGRGAYGPAICFSGTGSTAGDQITANFGKTTYVHAAPAGFGNWPGTFPIIATLDGITANTALSNGNLTATHSNTSTNSGARSASNMSAHDGRFYFEVTCGHTTGANDCIGVLDRNGTFADALGSTNSSVVFCNTGNIYFYSSASGKSIGSITAGDVIGVAVDYNDNKIWFRKNGGAWNGDPTADPTARTGSANLAYFNSTPFVAFGGTGTASGDNFTFNFGKTAFSATPPAGFIVWPDKKRVLTPPLLTAPDVFYSEAVGVLLINVDTVVVEPDAFFAPTVVRIGLEPNLVLDSDAVFQPTSTGGTSTVPSWVPAGAVVHIDFVGQQAWTQTSGEVAIATLVGADANTSYVWGADSEYDPSFLTADGYVYPDSSYSKTIALIGDALAKLLANATVRYQVKQLDSVNQHTTYWLMCAAASYYALEIDVYSGAANDINAYSWFGTLNDYVTGATSDTLNVIAFTVTPTRFEFAVNGSTPDVATIDSDAYPTSGPNQLVASFFDQYSNSYALQSITLYDPFADPADLTALSVP